MKILTKVRILFVVAGLYSGIFGMLFFLIPRQMFSVLNIIPQVNHIIFVQFPALLVFVFALMFFKIANDPQKNVDLIMYGIFMKLSFCAVVFYHWFSGTISAFWVSLAFLNLAFLFTFVIAHREIRKTLT